MKALSIKQPWAWFIVEGYKPIENRSWPMPKEMVGQWCFIHASKSYVKSEWDQACKFAIKAGVTHLPNPDRIARGGIIGMVKLTRCVMQSDSPWFVGKFGFVMVRPYPLPFLPYAGQTGFFEVNYGEWSPKGKLCTPINAKFASESGSVTSLR